MAKAPPPTAPLEALVTRAVAGDTSALTAVCKELEAPVFRLAFRMLGDRHDAEDAAQEVLVKVITSLASFEGRSAFMTWVHTIAVRHVLGCRRSRSEARALDERAFAALLEQGRAFGAERPPPTPEERTLVHEIQLSCTQGMLLMLGRDERLAIVLVELLGFDGAEAAEIVGATHEAFRQRLTRARGKLGEFLKTRCGVANPRVACRCEDQVAAKRALGLTQLRILPLSTGDLVPPARDAELVVMGTAELQSIRAIATTFHVNGSLGAPESLRARLHAALPTIFGTPSASQ